MEAIGVAAGQSYNSGASPRCRRQRQREKEKERTSPDLWWRRLPWEVVARRCFGFQIYGVAARRPNMLDAADAGCPGQDPLRW